MPLTAAQNGMWYAQALDPGSPAQNTAEYIEIHGPLDPVLFAEALHRTVGEAEALRMRIEETPDGPPHPLHAECLPVRSADGRHSVRGRTGRSLGEELVLPTR